MKEFIVNKLVERLKETELGIPSADGEWNWINDKYRSDYLQSIYTKDFVLLKEFLLNPLSAQVAYGIITPIEPHNSQVDFGSNFEADLELYKKIYGLSSLEDLKHDELLHHPWSKQTEIFRTYPDSPRHAHFARQIIEISDTAKIGVEIGGGYGGMIYFLFKFGFKSKIINCDLLETLLIAYVFLSLNGVSVELCLTHGQFLDAINKGAHVILITPNIFDSLSSISEIEFVFNSRSFSEMSASQSSYYLGEVSNTLKPTFVISENAEELLFPDSDRHVEKIQDELANDLRGYVLVSKARTYFIGGSGRYTTRIYSHKFQD
jgi:hypothetical protein